MLKSLYIKNFALIDEIEVHFTNGLNIIIGPTGAGKSIIFDALMQALGERSDVNFIKKDKQKTIIEAIFYIQNFNAFLEILKDEETITNSEILLRREISAKGTSRAFINDTPIPILTLKEIGQLLVDFHGQHTHQQLLSQKSQLNLLDILSKNTELLKTYNNLYQKLQQKIKNYKELKEKKTILKSKTEELAQVLKELERVNPQPNEIQEIEAELLMLENYEMIFSTLNEIYNLSYLSNNSIVELFGKVVKQLNKLTKYDKSLKSMLEDLLTAQNIVSEVSKQIYDKINEIEFDQNRVEFLRSRLGELKYLEKKYITFENIFQEKEKIERLLQDLQNSEELITNVIKEINDIKQKISEIALQLHQKRKESANFLEKELPILLNSLGMRNSKFNVLFTHSYLTNYSIDSFGTKLDDKFIKINEDGIDNVEFYISTNPNSKLLPLDKIVSGGEISRIMLGLKSLVANIYQFPTMIFDEIDVGISGKIAKKAGLLMKKIARNHQVIAITHLPQIAAAADNITLISKDENDNNVVVMAKTLSEEDKIKEIAKLLSGDKITKSALDNAENLIKEYQM